LLPCIDWFAVCKDLNYDEEQEEGETGEDEQATAKPLCSKGQQSEEAQDDCAPTKAKDQQQSEEAQDDYVADGADGLPRHYKDLLLISS
jgi:hypothetical protein